MNMKPWHLSVFVLASLLLQKGQGSVQPQNVEYSKLLQRCLEQCLEKPVGGHSPCMDGCILTVATPATTTTTTLATEPEVTPSETTMTKLGCVAWKRCQSCNGKKGKKKATCLRGCVKGCKKKQPDTMQRCREQCKRPYKRPAGMTMCLRDCLKGKGKKTTPTPDTTISTKPEQATPTTAIVNTTSETEGPEKETTTTTTTPSKECTKSKRCQSCRDKRGKKRSKCPRSCKKGCEDTKEQPDRQSCKKKCKRPGMRPDGMKKCMDSCMEGDVTTNASTNDATILTTPSEGCQKGKGKRKKEGRKSCLKKCNRKKGKQRKSCRKDCDVGCKEEEKQVKPCWDRCRKGSFPEKKRCLSVCAKDVLKPTTPKLSTASPPDNETIAPSIESETTREMVVEYTKDEQCPVDTSLWNKLRQGKLDVQEMLEFMTKYPKLSRCIRQCLPHGRQCILEKCLPECKKGAGVRVEPVTTGATPPETTARATRAPETRGAYVRVAPVTTGATPPETTAQTTRAPETREECPPTFKYTECASKCVATCLDRTPECARGGCKRDTHCACPPGTVQPDERTQTCVPVSQCSELLAEEHSCKSRCSNDTECVPKKRSEKRSQIKAIPPSCWECISPICESRARISDSCIYNSITRFCSDACPGISPCTYCFEC